MYFPTMFAALFLASSTASPVQQTTSADPIIPVSLRECLLTKAPISLFNPFVAYLKTIEPTTIRNTMSYKVWQYNVTDTCLQVGVYNWSCDHDLNVTGPGIANAVASIAQQCDGYVYPDGEVTGPFGFGYYKNLDSGYEYTKHLWVYTTKCTRDYLKSACSPGA